MLLHGHHRCLLSLCLFGLLMQSCSFNRGTALNPAGEPSLSSQVAAKKEARDNSLPCLRLVQMQGGRYLADPSVVDYVEAVGNKLITHSDDVKISCRFTVVNDSIPDAWSLPDGNVAISRGLLVELNNEAELAAVLSHEIASIVSLNNFSEAEVITAVAVSNPTFSRAIGSGCASHKIRCRACVEGFADALAIKVMVAAGYDPQAALDYQQRLWKLESSNEKWNGGFLATHPCSEERLAALMAVVRSVPAGGYVGEENYQEKTRRLRTNNTSYSQLDLANKALWEGKLDVAQHLAKEGREATPQEGRFLWILGRVCLQQMRYTEGITYFNQALVTDDQYFDYYLQRGICHLNLGNHKEALKDLRSSLALLPTADAHFHLGELALEMGDRAAAGHHLLQASASEGPLAALAAEQLAAMEIKENPAKYVSLKAALDKRGYLTIAAVNNSPVPVRNVVVSLRVVNAPNVRYSNKVIRFKDEIASGKSSSSFTGIGPFDGKQHLKGCLEAIVVGASPMMSVE